MRAPILAVILVAASTGAMAATDSVKPTAKPAPAAAGQPGTKPPAPVKLAPDDIQKTFFTGQPFTSATPAGVSFKMTFTADGKMKREPAGKGGSKGEGTWSLDKTGFCTTWKGAKQNCFVVVSTTEKKWSVMKGAAVVAAWTK